MLNALDTLLEVVIGMSAQGGVATEATPAVIQLVMGEWFQKIHPVLYRRLVHLKRLETGGQVATETASGNVALKADLKRALHMVELAQKQIDADKLEKANLQRKLDNANTLLETAKNNLQVSKRDMASLQRKLDNTNKLLEVAKNNLQAGGRGSEAEMRQLKMEVSSFRNRLEQAAETKRLMEGRIADLEKVVRDDAELEQQLRERLAFAEDLSSADREARASVPPVATGALAELQATVVAMEEEIRELE